MSSNKENKLTECVQVIESISFSLTAIIGVILNGFITISVRYITKPYISTKICSHLSLANLIGCIFVILVQGFGDTWLLNNNGCTVFMVAKSFWYSSVILLTSFLVYEGVIKVRYRLQQLKKSEIEIKDGGCLSLNFTLVLVWASCVVITLFTLFFISINNESSLCLAYQHTKKELVRYYLAFIIVLPLLIIVIMYVYYKRISINNRRSIGTYERDKTRLDIQRDMHYLKSSFYISHVLLITWLPHTLYMFCLIDWYIDNIYFNETTYHVLRFIQWVCYMSCLVQPIIIIKTNYQIQLKIARQMKDVCCFVFGRPRPIIEKNNEKEGRVTSVSHTQSVPNMKLHNNSFTKQTIATTEINIEADISNT